MKTGKAQIDSRKKIVKSVTIGMQILGWEIILRSTYMEDL